MATNGLYLEKASRADWVDVDVVPRGKWPRLAGGVQRNGRRASTEMVVLEVCVQRMVGVPWGMQGRELYSQTLIEVKKAW